MTQPLPLSSRRVFVDTSANFAVINRRDTYHNIAIAISTRLTQQRWRLFTTNYILAETHALLLTRLDRATALTFLQVIGPTTIRAATADERRTREIIGRYTNKNFSLADAISFSVMERLNIRYAFTFDQHFAQSGFTVLTPEIV